MRAGVCDRGWGVYKPHTSVKPLMAAIGDVRAVRLSTAWINLRLIGID
jgi:hypothetical protein